MSFEPVWERVLLTGGGGFVGTCFQQMLLERGLSGAVTVCNGPSERGLGISLDVRDREQVSAVIAQVRPTVVVHLAAIAAVTAANSDARLAWDVNLGGTLNLVDSIRAHSPESRLLFVSSAEVYGRSLNSAVPVDERQLLDPVNPYAASKAAADILVRQSSANGLRSIIARPFNHIGPGQALAFVAPSFAAQIAAIEHGLQPPILSVGSLDDERDFLDVRDVVNAYCGMINAFDRVEPGTTFNVASGKAIRIGDILEHLLSLSSTKIQVVKDPSRLRPAPIPRVVGDATAARQALDWAPRYDIKETLGSILQRSRDIVKS